MSGGHWGYKQYQILEQAEQMEDILRAVARTEHIVDWAMCGDTGRDEAAQALFDLWVETFDQVYGNAG